MPKIQRDFTQFEKDTFLREAFSSAEDYFRTALANLKRETVDVETDLNEIHKYKFICTAYIKGESYSDSDNSMNDWLTVKDDGQQLGFETSGMWFKADYSGRNFLTVEEASEYLWRRFTDRLTRR
ncbi:MAG: hypothetical protein OJF51_000124 [Nitrospira sp.]|jgi:hypothetical protein|nr:MAG: hypothetical protein OJF51_000124 [Nitrospira sp.]